MINQCHRVVAISNGKIVFDGKPENAIPIIENHPHTTSLEAIR
jgi:ABC-type phosphate/phosphonate transport system ATPase subunit